MICQMCGKEFRGNVSDILPGKNLCELCASNVRKYAKGETSAERNDAYEYLLTCREITQDGKIVNAIDSLIRQHSVLPAEPEPDSSLIKLWQHASSHSAGSGKELPYIVYQITLKEKLLGTGSRNLTELEEVLNHFFSKGYRLHSISTTTSTGGSMGFAGGDRIPATLVFEKIDLFK